MEYEAFFQEKVYLTPNDLRGEVQSVDEILLNKVKQRLEQRCSPHGYVLPSTLELITRSAGSVDSGRFSGDWSFLVKAKGRVLNPSEGTLVNVEVLKSNKMGIYAVYENAIRIMVPRDLHLGDDEFDQLKVGEMISVEIQKSKFQLRDPFIVSVGIYRGRAGAATEALPAARLDRSVQLGTVSEAVLEPDEAAEGADGADGADDADDADGADDAEEEEEEADGAEGSEEASVPEE